MKKYSKTVLLLPFLRIPSGHHQVADTLIQAIKQKQPEINCKKIEILSYSYGNIESFISAVYLKWIQTFPSLYHWMYQYNVYRNLERKKKYKLYEWLFLASMKKIMEKTQPDFVICTHALPSYMLNRLKEKGVLTVPVVNVYTDFFIHCFWGIQHIDFHFVPSLDMKAFLQKKGVKEEQIFITGIPVHQEIVKQKKQPVTTASRSLSLLITGGSLGVGMLEKLIANLKPQGRVTYYVLCGRNSTLYEKIKKLHNSYIIPLKYIESRKEMNRLYEQTDGILTKPGGVTISESLTKRKPAFIYGALPGQEMINLQFLQKSGLIFYLHDWENTSISLEEQLYAFFRDKEQVNKIQTSIDQYHDQLSDADLAGIINRLLGES